MLFIGKKEIDFKISLLVLFIIPSLGWCPPVPKVPWIDKLFYATVLYLNARNEMAIIRNGKHYKIPESDIQRACVYAWDAAVYNPKWYGKWDGRKLACVRLLAVHYEQASFNLYAVNTENTNGSTDMGPMQINSVHWYGADKNSLWYRFCFQQGLNPGKIWSIVNPRNNFKFAAVLNENFLKTNRESYHFDENERERKFYRFLLKRLGMSNELAEFDETQDNTEIVSGN